MDNTEDKKEENIKSNSDQPTTDQNEVKEHNFITKIQRFWRFLLTVINLRRGIDRKATLEGIKHDVEFKGHAAWILMCSILIACIGLSENNIAIIIGAMLISPLMGPILGVGMAAGINDFELLKKSLTNFGIAIFISLVVSTLYFAVMPVPETTPELYGRRNASILAIAIAFLGGLAGIIAGSRTFKSNVVPGVAIATALMPPLCTAGYGLATLNIDFFLGALYLFLINSAFIAIPTYLYIKYMNFPLVQFVDPKRERRIKRNITIVLLIIIIPSGLFFYQVLNRSIYKRNANNFISHVKEDLKKTNTFISGDEIIDSDEGQEIIIVLTGDYVAQNQIVVWKEDLRNFDLSASNLSIVQGQDFSSRISELMEVNEKDKQEIFNNVQFANELKFQELQTRINRLESDSLSMVQSIKSEISNWYADILSVELESIESTDTLNRLSIRKRIHMDFEYPKEELERNQIRSWLESRLPVDSLEIIINHP